MRRLVPARLLAALKPDSKVRHELPSDVVRESRRRVRVAAALGAGAYLVFLAFEWSGVVASKALEHRIDLTHDVLGIALCLSLLLIASLPSVPDRWVLNAALTFEVLLSLLISVGVSWASFVRTLHAQSLTWVVPVIILFAVLVPAPPRTALGLSILSALMMPLGLAVLAASGRIAAPASDYWSACVTGAIAVAIAAAASRTIYRAARQVAALQTVGSYELLERLSEGGMGEVWKARHLLLARLAAVKLILPEHLQGPAEQRDTALQRFKREAQVTAELRSPHTVELFDFGVSGDGSLYYAMELLEGMNVEHFVYRFGPIEPRRAVDWLLQACHSLGEAHARNLIHRDIKPANIFLCRYGRDVDFVKILDFGLTKPTVPMTRPELTAPGTALGTPGYMAPEQVFGLETGPATDLYSLGCVAYFLLAGAKPFDADSGGELMRQHVQVPPPPLAARATQAVPARLEALIMACLAKDPAARPRDADAMSAELAMCVDGAPWSPADAQRWWEKHLEPA
jgi:eukaryotic-like serine/threonine-protein kinase